MGSSAPARSPQAETGRRPRAAGKEGRMNETVLIDGAAEDIGSAEIADCVPAGDDRAALSGSTAIVVLGMHRSGTSALTGMLRHLGVVLGDNMMPPTTDNPRGYWEQADIVDLHQKTMAGHGMAWDDI